MSIWRWGVSLLLSFKSWQSTFVVKSGFVDPINPKLALKYPKLALQCPKLVPKCPKLAPLHPKLALRHPNLAFKCSKLISWGLRLSSICPKLASICPNLASLCPKLTSLCLKLASLCHDARSGRQTYPFFVKDQHWSRSYVIIFCERPRCLVCHPEILMQNLIYFRSYRSFSVKNIILDFNKKIGTGKRLFHNFTPLHLWEKQQARAFSQLF